MTEAIINGTLILAAILIAVYLAYIGGILTFTSHASLIYVGNIKRAHFSKCNGTFKRVIWLDGAKSYRFELKQELSQGSVTAKVISNRKEVLLSLDSKAPIGNIYPQQKSRYYLVVKIEKATGSYELDWT